MLSAGVRLSVKLGYIQTAEDIVRLLYRPGSTITLVFFILSADTKCQGELLQRGRKIHRGWNFFIAIFD